nr:hypothetical protein [Microbacterium sp. NIBRBAC000506063]
MRGHRRLHAQHDDGVGGCRQRGQHHVDADEEFRQALTRLPDPDEDLHEDGAAENQQPAPRAQLLRDGDGGEHDDQRREDVARPGVDVRDDGGVEPLADDLGISGMRARSGGEDAEEDGEGEREPRDMREDREPSRHGDLPGAGGLVHPHQERRGDADQEQGRRVVEADEEGVEPGQHGDAADEALRDDADERQAGQQREVAARGDGPDRIHCSDDHHQEESRRGRDERGQVEQRGDRIHPDGGGDPAECVPEDARDGAPAARGVEDEQQHDDRESADDAGHRAIAELDDAVKALLGRRDQRFRGAHRPLGASESGTGEPHRAACPDDDDLREERQPGEHPERTRDAYRRVGGRVLSDMGLLRSAQEPVGPGSHAKPVESKCCDAREACWSRRYQFRRDDLRR